MYLLIFNHEKHLFFPTYEMEEIGWTPYWGGTKPPKCSEFSSSSYRRIAKEVASEIRRAQQGTTASFHCTVTMTVALCSTSSGNMHQTQPTCNALL